MNAMKMDAKRSICSVKMIKYVKDILVFQSTKKLDLYNQNELEQVKKIFWRMV